MNERRAVIEANEAFYAAFRARDNAAMAALWSSSARVVCVHPGWAAIEGRTTVF